MKFTLVYDYPNLKKVTCSNNWNYTCSAVLDLLYHGRETNNVYCQYDALFS